MFIFVPNIILMPLRKWHALLWWHENQVIRPQLQTPTCFPRAILPALPLASVKSPLCDWRGLFAMLPMSSLFTRALFFHSNSILIFNPIFVAVACFLVKNSNCILWVCDLSPTIPKDIYVYTHVYIERACTTTHTHTHTLICWSLFSSLLPWKFTLVINTFALWSGSISMTDYSMPRCSVTEIHPLYYICKNGKQLHVEKCLTSYTWGEKLYAFTVFHINLNI